MDFFFLSPCFFLIGLVASTLWELSLVLIDYLTCSKTVSRSLGTSLVCRVQDRGRIFRCYGFMFAFSTM